MWLHRSKDSSVKDFGEWSGVGEGRGGGGGEGREGEGRRGGQAKGGEGIYPAEDIERRNDENDVIFYQARLTSLLSMISSRPSYTE